MQPIQVEPKAPIRVALLDDQKVVREALGALLEEGGSALVVCSLHQADALEAVGTRGASVVLIGFDAQLHDPIATVNRAARMYPTIGLCALVAGERPVRVHEAMAAGCGGVVSSSASVEVLLAALESLAEGQPFVDPTLAGELLSAELSGKHNGHVGKHKLVKKDEGGTPGHTAGAGE